MSNIRSVTPKIADNDLIRRALEILESRIRRSAYELSQAGDVVDYLRLKLGNLDYEGFYVIYLDVANRVLGHELLFKGSTTSSHVYPREVIRRMFEHNATAIVVAHNHPGGTPKPSVVDYKMTKNLMEALSYVECKLLDHIVVTASGAYSMDANGTLPSLN